LWVGVVRNGEFFGHADDRLHALRRADPVQRLVARSLSLRSRRMALALTRVRAVAANAAHFSAANSPAQSVNFRSDFVGCTVVAPSRNEASLAPTRCTG